MTVRASESRIHRSVLTGLELCFLLLCVTLAFRLGTPGPVRIEDRRGDAGVLFAADRSVIFAPGTCLIVNWRVAGVREVTLNGSPVIDEASTRMCVERDRQPVLRVVFQDGTAQDYRLEIKFFVQQPENGLLVLLAILRLFVWLYFMPSRWFEWPALPRRLTRVALLTVFGVVLTTLIMELGLRFYFSNFGTKADKIAYLYSREQINQLDPYALTLPEVDYGLSPANPEHNRLGYRGAEIDVPKPPGVFRIIAIGGSTTYGTSVKADETYPYFLQKILRENYGYARVEVVNAGVYGYTSYQNLANMAFRIPELEPDLVIHYDNANDILTREVNPDCYRGINPLLGLDPRDRVATGTSSQPVSPSTLYRFLAIAFGLEANPASVDSMFASGGVACGDGKTYTPEQELAANPPIYFERNLASMIGLARLHGFQMVLASWAYEENSSEPEVFWRNAVAEQNGVIQRVAEQYVVPLIDYAPAAPQTPENWADYVHMSAIGLRDQAAFFARFLVEHGLMAGAAVPTPTPAPDRVG